MTPTRKKTEPILLITALALCVLALCFLWADGFLPEQFSDFRTWHLFGEAVVLLGLLQGAGHAVCGRGRGYGLILLISSLFLWVHRIFLPVVVTGFYVALLMLLGEDLLLPVRRAEGRYAARGALRAVQDLLMGGAAMQIFLTGLSVLHVGGPGAVRKAAAVLLLLGLLFFLLFQKSGIFPLLLPEKVPEGSDDPVLKKTLLISVLWILLIHAGRMNITLDYDSVHYGLRSFYVLDNGRGIFENLGSVNAVYYYPKGLELLTLPLSGTPTYGFVLSFSFWCAVLVLLLTREMTGRIAGPLAGTLAMFFTACIPGVMNLATSAKTDMVTLLFQLLFAAEILERIRAREEDAAHALRPLFYAAGTLLFTLTLKPTAIAFSGALFLSWLLYEGLRAMREKRARAKRNSAARAAGTAGASASLNTQEIERARAAATGAAGSERATRAQNGGAHGPIWPFLWVIAVPGAALTGVTARTFRLTGYPLVTVFTGIWEKLGMHGKSPLAVQSVPNAAAGYSLKETVLYFAERCFRFFIAPVGEKALHIRIAWGTPLFLMLLLSLIAVLLQSHFKVKAETRAAAQPVAALVASADNTEGAAAGPAAGSVAQPAPATRARRSISCAVGEASGPAVRARFLTGYLLLTLAFLLLFDFLTLLLLYQVDGNYYNLSYVLTAVTAAVLWQGREKHILRCLAPAVLCALFVTGVTNWAGARGLTEPKLNHYGFYDHASDRMDRMILSGKDPVYRYLVNAARFRVLCVSQEPECYLFPCVAESYTDVEGSGGNVRLVHTLNEFKDYLDAACIPLIYAEDAFLSEHARAEEIIRYMKEDGSITPIISQEAYTLYEYHTGIR